MSCPKWWKCVICCYILRNMLIKYIVHHVVWIKVVLSIPLPVRIHLKRLIKNNAVYEKRAAHRRCCWYVHAEVLSRLGQDALPVPCQWTYLTAGAREDSRDEPQAATGSQGNSPTTPQTSSTTPSSSNKRKSTGSMSITRFMKRCADPEQVEKCAEMLDVVTLWCSFQQLIFLRKWFSP